MESHINSLNWKLNNIYTSPKSFISSIKGGNTETKKIKSSPWTLDIILYVLLFAVLIAFVYFVISFANDFNQSKK